MSKLSPNFLAPPEDRTLKAIITAFDAEARFISDSFIAPTAE